MTNAKIYRNPPQLVENIFLVTARCKIFYRDISEFAHDIYKVEKKGEKVAVVALGDFYQKGEAVAAAIKSALGFEPTLINPRFASGVDKKLLEDLKKDHGLVITLEDGITSGGFGEKIASFYGTSNMKVKNYGLEKKFYDRYNPAGLLKELGMSTEQILADVKGILGK